MPQGASPKREHEYKELVQEFHEEHRYPGREEEVAARIVNKQRAEFSETQQAKQDDRTGESPDSNLPLPRYDHLTVEQIEAQLDGMDERELEELREYEAQHRNRKTLMENLDQRRNG